jgi:hypothetical protein
MKAVKKPASLNVASRQISLLASALCLLAGLLWLTFTGGADAAAAGLCYIGLFYGAIALAGNLRSIRSHRNPLPQQRVAGASSKLRPDCILAA